MKNIIYNEDCLETMKGMANGSIDLTVTSPPYDTLREYKGFSFDFENIAKELVRVTKDGGFIVWVVGDETKDFCESLSSFKQAIFFVHESSLRQ
jgi:site-specific DNA-methyltransferase (adenine-specific)